jgi:hypothetical protein
MASPTSPVDVKLPQRSGTVSSGFTRRTSMSDDEAIPQTDSSEVCSWRLGVPAGRMAAAEPRGGMEGLTTCSSVQYRLPIC